MELSREVDKLFTAQESRELDRMTIADHGVPGIVLMKRAGLAAFDALTATFDACTSITVVCGKGNNAGDGYIVAGLARESGMRVELLQLGDPAGLQGDAATARDWALGSGVDIRRLDEAAPQVEIGGEVVVDALLGTGITGEIRAGFAKAVDAINAAGRPVVAIDIPSGLDADTGAVLGKAVCADLTVTFIGPKRGLYTGAGVDRVGRVVYAPIGVPREVLDSIDGVPVARWSDWSRRLPERSRGAHKHLSGHVLVVGGDHGMGGAALMAGEAALRVGAGLVSVATRADHVSGFLSRRPELMVRGVDNEAQLTPLLDAATVVALGPGLGSDTWGERLFDAVLAAGRPTVVDADGLNRLAERQSTLPAQCIITPHPGEAGRLLGSSSAEVQHDRFAAAAALSSRFGAATILKGAGSLITDAGATWLCGHGNPAMASAGMGDVLTGVVAGLHAQARDTTIAAVAGACLHAAAGDQAATRDGARGLVATDVTAELRELLR